ncbi:hypothetical protein AAFX91_41205 [Bradyrhizobium sp. 31Argb]|uniref:hypothetical protein n=1 Tax=unclassified Bradyrhizobium TaxID=2631580 RepID=UPI00249E99F5|nr:hypothetical protein [Bradyrhizobium sp. Arg237L]MDI4238047.1 hypothetical protein [Bradyrhizobium sp. Arg237L]
MVVFNKTGSMNNFQSLLISVDRLEQKRAELLALREKVSNAERAIQRLLIGFPKEKGWLAVGPNEFQDAIASAIASGIGVRGPPDRSR